MSVLITGMKTPENCSACPLRLAWCRERIYMETRPERCPSQSQPENGRFINAEALLDKFEKEAKAAEEHGRDFSFSFMRGDTPCAEWWAVMHIVEDFIAVSGDTRTVVFCRDCFHWDIENKHLATCGHWLSKCGWFTRQGNYIETSAGDYCSYGCRLTGTMKNAKWEAP